MRATNPSIFRFIAFVIASLVIFSCNKDPQKIGIDLVDATRNVVGLDTTISITAWSSIDDSVVSDETSVNLLGSQFTHTYGLTNTSFYTHLRLSTSQPDFGENPVGDSAILTLVYDGSFGNIGTPQTAIVYRINDTVGMFKDSTYYSNSFFSIDETELANHTFYPNPTDSVLIDTVKYAPELRVPLNEVFMNSILNPEDPDALLSNEDFLEYYKGIYVTTPSVSVPGHGAILSFDLLNSRSNVTIYYHNDTEDSLNYRLEINLNNARVGRFEHDYSLSTDVDFKNQILEGETSIGNSKLYLQGLGGIKTTLKFPGLADFINQENIGINEAKLIIPAMEQMDGLDIPENLILFQYDKNGVAGFTEDQLEGDNYFGGNLNTGNNEYLFRISFYLQDLLGGSTDYGLVLFPSSKSVKPNGVSLFGTGSNLPSKMYLRIIYTQID